MEELTELQRFQHSMLGRIIMGHEVEHLEKYLLWRCTGGRSWSCLRCSQRPWAVRRCSNSIWTQDRSKQGWDLMHGTRDIAVARYMDYISSKCPIEISNFMNLTIPGPRKGHKWYIYRVGKHTWRPRALHTSLFNLQCTVDAHAILDDCRSVEMTNTPIQAKPMLRKA